MWNWPHSYSLVSLNACYRSKGWYLLSWLAMAGRAVANIDKRFIAWIDNFWLVGQLVARKACGEGKKLDNLLANWLDACMHAESMTNFYAWVFMHFPPFLPSLLFCQSGKIYRDFLSPFFLFSSPVSELRLPISEKQAKTKLGKLNKLNIVLPGTGRERRGKSLN